MKKIFLVVGIVFFIMLFVFLASSVLADPHRHHRHHHHYHFGIWIGPPTIWWTPYPYYYRPWYPPYDYQPYYYYRDWVPGRWEWRWNDYSRYWR